MRVQNIEAEWRRREAPYSDPPQEDDDTEWIGEMISHCEKLQREIFEITLEQQEMTTTLRALRYLNFYRKGQLIEQYEELLRSRRSELELIRRRLAEKGYGVGETSAGCAVCTTGSGSTRAYWR